MGGCESCLSSYATSKSTGGDARVTEDDLSKSNTEFWRHKELSFSFGIYSQQANVPIILVRFLLLAARFSQRCQTPGCQHQRILSRQSTSTHFGPILRLRLSFLSLFKEVLLPNFKKAVGRETLIMEVQQLEDIFCIIRTN